MALNLRYSPLEYDRSRNSFNFGGAQLENFMANEVFGNTYWVEGRKGEDADNGLTLAHAFKTVARALTAQAAHRADKSQYNWDYGDQIIVMPGMYTANLAPGTLTNCVLRGIPSGLGSLSIIRGVEGHATWHGDIADSTIKDIEFQGNDVNAEVFLTKTIMKSTFHNVTFRSRRVGALGLCIGSSTSGSSETWELMRDSLLSNCIFTCDTKANDLYCAINFGVYADDDTNAAQRLFQRSRITGCNIQAQKRGINMLTGNSNNQGSVIDYNTITSNLAPAGPAEYGIRHNDSEFMVLIANNRIKSGATAISGFADYNLLGNIVAGGDAVPVFQYAI